MSFHPNEVARRSRVAQGVILVTFVLLLSAFFRTQIIRNEEYALKSEENRLREVPLPAPRGIIFDRNGDIIAENVPGYSVSMLADSASQLRSSLRRLAETIELSPDQIDAAVRRYERAPNRPTVILSDATIDVVSVLEERRVEFPGLIIQSAPKRYYPDGQIVGPFVGYTGEITEAELSAPDFQGYKAGQQIGKGGIERQYEQRLRGREGMRFVEVDALGRVVREAGARQDLPPEVGPNLQTNIDLRLQRYTASLFADSLQGGAIAIEPRTGAVLALYSAPTFDPNRFIGGIPIQYWRELNTDPRRPLYNKVIQGRYPPGSTFKLATAVIALQENVATLDSRMPTPCTGGYTYFGRYFRCWYRDGHGTVDMRRAVAVSCNVYFYQLGLKIGLSRLIAGGVHLGFREKSGIDIPNETSPLWPYAEEYYNRRFGPRGWTTAVTLNLAIGQGENSQTVASMARFYTALATDGQAATPELMRTGREVERTRIFQLTPQQLAGLRAAMTEVVSERGTAGGSRIQGITLAGKTGTAQTAEDPNLSHAWFTGFAPAEDPQIVVAVMLEFGDHGWRAARIASRMVEYWLRDIPEMDRITGPGQVASVAP